MVSKLVMGPYRLAGDAIDATVTEKSAGSFVLGVTLPDGTFVPRALGRSDSDVRKELALWMRQNVTWDSFTYCYADTPHEAFEQQCRDFHTCTDCDVLESPNHPTRPNHTHWICPVCGEAFLEET